MRADVCVRLIVIQPQTKGFNHGCHTVDEPGGHYTAQKTRRNGRKKGGRKEEGGK